MKVLRTPDDRFEDLLDYPFAPHYVEAQKEGLRIHYVEEGKAAASPVLLMHGEPTWSYLYRHFITPLVRAGCRVIAPDFIGFGRSDKPSEIEDYSYQKHVDWMTEWLEKLDLQNITLFCQDWGSLIGLRLVAEHPQRFARVILANGGLPTGEGKVPFAFRVWRTFAVNSPFFPIGKITSKGCVRKLSEEEIAAYDAPFPSEEYKSGARAFPRLVPTTLDDPAGPANRAARESLKQFEKPFLTAFSDKDPITRGQDRPFQRLVPGAKNQPHATIRNAGHFLQEDAAEELVQLILDFIARTS